jgi:mannose-1-phosphate guanylyltransferase
MHNRKSSATWNIVLAATEGRRPLQAFDGGLTPFQRTIKCITAFAPAERTVVVTSEPRADLSAQQLAPYPAVELIVQPTNRGTGPGTMLPLARVLARDPDAEVLIFPAYHQFARPGQFLEACQSALATAVAAESGVALVAVPAERPDTELGWIVPGEPLARAAPRGKSVRQFVNKPDETAAWNLLACGGLWNTRIMGGRVQALWRLLERHLPRQAQVLAPLRICRAEPPTALLLRQLYRCLDPADLSRDVLQPATGLGVVCMVDAGWSDGEAPERLPAVIELGPQPVTPATRRPTGKV